MINEKSTRINKYLSEAGYCSRRKADKLLDEGKITINGKIPEMGTKVGEGDEVCVNGNLVERPNKKPTYLAFNKPVGIVCTTDTRVEKDNIIDYINYPKRIFPIGRLDKSSEGLILLTDDGEIVNKILRSRNEHGKEYQVKVDRPVTASFVKRMGEGVPILDTVTKPCTVEKTGSHDFKIILTQGLNRQIRRMVNYFDFNVVKLRRKRIMNIELDLPIGKYRDLRDDELRELKRLIKYSDKTA